ncbi:segregation/condensation protein A [Candidatus Woesearchaeota archaeon]|nr:segregation/condensation protein A [Candidatus Woesearchaeota archaeon]
MSAEEKSEDLNSNVPENHTDMELTSLENQSSQDRIFSILFQEDEITWQNIIYDLVRQEGMDPWDINISEIAHKFLGMLRKLREMDFRISGKVVLASALLLKLKSEKLLEEDITAWDNMISSMDDPGELLDELGLEGGTPKREKILAPGLMPRTPQPRKRKVSVYDLIEALEKALEVEYRRPVYVEPTVKLKAPEKFIDMGELIQGVFQKVETYYSSNGKADEKGQPQKLTFSELIPSDSKEDKVYTFIPLLHLENQRKVDMYQQMHFGEIEIELLKNNAPLNLAAIPVKEDGSAEFGFDSGETPPEE